ncbi:non-structural maintenance of chromosomes element 3 homolog [Penaeus indicus]|uniref:non-structural maintenance of chromosomes element 3 homolog n=1 Tax=Penaeus indicus TaxID=29960 RepID=UPI00300DB975
MSRRRVLEVSSDEGPSQSQPASQRSQSQGVSEISDHDKKMLAGNVCNFLMVSDCKKTPAKRSDIVKAVLKEHGRHFKEILAEANQIMERVYGYKVVELETKNQFIMVNTLMMNNNNDNDDLLLAPKSSSEAASMGLITAILAGIFMSGQVMQEGPMREYLKKLGIDIDSQEEHPTFGNITKYFQDLVKQQYLQTTKNKDVEPPTNEYRWGERAHKELSKKDILEFVCKVYGNQTRPEDWVTQWKIVKKEEEES